MAKRKLNGENLDQALKAELEKMLQDGYTLSPISRPALQKRLGLNSRGTLSIPVRATLIENARIKQLRDAGLDSSGKKRRNTLQEQNERLKEKIVGLQEERDALVEKLAMIINGIQAKGYDLDELMIPLRNL